MKELQHSQTKRQTGIDLLKIVAFAMIVLAHAGERDFSETSEAFIALSQIQGVNFYGELVLSHFGQFGNAIFVACSAYFLVDSKRVKWEKVGNIAADTRVFSALWIGITVLSGIQLDPGRWKNYLLPIATEEYWFVTCYLVFYILHPALNQIIYGFEKKRMLLATAGLFLVYSVLNTLVGNWMFYRTRLVGFIVIYFVVAYVKLYLPRFAADTKKNAVLLAVSVSALLVWIVGCAALADKSVLFAKLGSKSRIFSNPLMILSAIALLNLFRQLPIHAGWISRVSSLSLLIYLAHANQQFETYFTSSFWEWVYRTSTFSHVLLWRFLWALCMFTGSLLVAIVYRCTLGKLVKKAAHWFVGVAGACVSAVTGPLLKLE